MKIDRPQKPDDTDRVRLEVALLPFGLDCEAISFRQPDLRDPSDYRDASERLDYDELSDLPPSHPVSGILCRCNFSRKGQVHLDSQRAHAETVPRYLAFSKG